MVNAIVTGLATIVLTAGPALAVNWTCRNHDAEISCDKASCKITGKPNFTPGELTLSAQGDLQLCAYSGCWRGKAAVITRTRHMLTAVGVDLPWSSPGGKPGTVAVVIDTRNHVASLNADGFAHPMRCTTK